MRYAIHALLAFAMLLAISVALTACSWFAPAAPSSSSATRSTPATIATSPPTADVDIPRDETPAQAAKRLFEDSYDTAMMVLGNSQLLKGAAPGSPVAVSRDYRGDEPALARWVLANRSFVSNHMFSAMRSIAMSTSAYVVPVVSSGRVIGQFDLHRDQDGYWATDGIQPDPLPGGELLDLQNATSALHRSLGNEAKVRVAVFLPSGLMFAVGDAKGREAAVLLEPVSGPGVTGFDKPQPKQNAVLTPSELKTLLAPPPPSPALKRYPLGTID